jgi:glutathione-regulated potassium-efflux system ancillary protein KefG
MPSPRRILILYAHPAPQKSRVNRALIAAARGISSVTVHDLYENYPDLNIDVKREQKLLLEHDVVVLQHPFYWYNVPSILKEWCDLVLEYGFAYGEGGTALRGKAWIHSLTSGGTLEAYSPEGHNRFTIRQFLAPWDQTAHLCEMPFLAPFTLHGALNMDSKKDLPRAVAQFVRMVEMLRDTPAPWTELMKHERINALVDQYGGHT